MTIVFLRDFVLQSSGTGSFGRCTAVALLINLAVLSLAGCASHSKAGSDAVGLVDDWAIATTLSVEVVNPLTNFTTNAMGLRASKACFERVRKLAPDSGDPAFDRAVVRTGSLFPYGRGPDAAWRWPFQTERPWTLRVALESEAGYDQVVATRCRFNVKDQKKRSLLATQEGGCDEHTFQLDPNIAVIDVDVEVMALSGSALPTIQRALHDLATDDSAKKDFQQAFPQCSSEQNIQELADEKLSIVWLANCQLSNSALDRSGSTPDKPFKLTSRHFQMVRKTILALGDSYFSGEGVPDSARDYKHPNGAWLDRRCHRSLWSGPALGAAFLADLPHRDPYGGILYSVTLLNLACSGAEIGVPASTEWGAGGLLSGYNGIETNKDIEKSLNLWGPIKSYQLPMFEGQATAGPVPEAKTDIPPVDVKSEDLSLRRCVQSKDDHTHVAMRPQLDQASCLLDFLPRPDPNRPEPDPRKPDLILLSIGGNDLGFGFALENLVKGELTEKAQRAIEDVIKTRRESNHRPASCVGPSAIDCRMRDMIKVIQAKWPNSSIALSTYPDPTRSDESGPRRGVYCDDERNSFYRKDRINLMDGREVFFGPGQAILFSYNSFVSQFHGRIRGTIDANEMKFIDNTFLQPLNKMIGEAMNAEHHVSIIEMARVSYGHGYCSRSSWISTYGQSQAAQGDLSNGISSGAAHPNIWGTRAQGCLIAARARALFEGMVVPGTSTVERDLKDDSNAYRPTPGCEQIIFELNKPVPPTITVFRPAAHAG